MRHLPNSNDPEELRRVVNRIWDAFDAMGKAGTTTTKQPVGTTTRTSGFSGSGGVGGVGSVGPQGPKGSTGATGSSGGTNLLVGTLDQWEMLVAADGGLLVDANGYALMGVNTANTVLCGVTGDSIQPMEF